MKPFESFLAPQFRQYVAYRQGLGYAMEPYRSYLLLFDRYLKETGANRDSLNPLYFLTMRTGIHLEPGTVNRLLSVVRCFFRFGLRCGICEQNPLQDVPPLKSRLFIPFVFSPEQIDQLLEACSRRIRRRESYFLFDCARYLAILLLARCGMRRSEPVRLLLEHYRPEEGTVYIEKTKFKKDRLIPIPKSVWSELNNYLAVRKALTRSDRNSYLLAGKGTHPLMDDHLYYFFRVLVKDLGINHPRRIAGNMIFGAPTPHSLRHSFAINTLGRIRTQGRDPQHALPVLAAYMGHREYRRTGAYLKVTDSKHLTGLIEFAKSRFSPL